MKTFLISVCSLTFVCFVYGAHEEHTPPPKKKQEKPAEHAAVPKGHPGSGGPHFEQNKPKVHAGQTGSVYHPHESNMPHHNLPYETPSPHHLTTPPHHLATKAGVVKPFKPQHFDFANKPKPVITPVKFDPARHVAGSERWVGKNYEVFRLYRPVWHDSFWWRSHYSRVVFVFGGWYYWNAGWWYPAWGYAPDAYYAYDGPIYAYNDLSPDQVVANVQTALQDQGYYNGEIDGALGPETREALANYQSDHELEVTGAIDQPTLASLGMA
jgi:hypothetical protein